MADMALELASVTVPLNGNVEKPQRGLCRLAHVSSEKDCTCTSPIECASVFVERFHGLHERLVLEKLEHGTAFSSGEDEAQQAFELVSVLYKVRFDTNTVQHLLMLFEVTL